MEMVVAVPLKEDRVQLTLLVVMEAQVLLLQLQDLQLHTQAAVVAVMALVEGLAVPVVVVKVVAIEVLLLLALQTLVVAVEEEVVYLLEGKTGGSGKVVIRYKYQ